MTVRPLPAAALLDVWDRAHDAAPALRAQILLAAGCPDETPDALAGLTVGRRDARLLEIRSRTFGDRLDAVVACPACGDLLQMDLPAAGLRVEGPGEGENVEPDEPAELFSVDRDGYTVRFRLPTGADLAAVGAAPESGPVALLARCVVEARRGEEAVGAEGLPEAVVAEVAGRMQEADPQAIPVLDLTCPACEHRWESPFDIASYFWTEIDGWARRTLQEVHDLASAFGWRERDILEMSARRRQGYLDLVRG